MLTSEDQSFGEIAIEPSGKNWLSYHAQEHPIHLWEMLDHDERQQIRVEFIKSFSQYCSKTENGGKMYWTPKGYRNRRILFNVLDSWWTETNWEGSLSDFQASIGELIGRATEYSGNYTKLRKELLAELERMEWPIPPIVIEWIIEHVARTRSDW